MGDVARQHPDQREDVIGWTLVLELGSAAGMQEQRCRQPASIPGE